MADKILHGTTEIVNTSAQVTDTALPNTGVTAAAYTSNNTQLVSFTVDAKGRLTAASNASVNVTPVTLTGVTFGNTSSHTHTENQRIYISTSAPANNSVGNNGDVWYQTLT